MHNVQQIIKWHNKTILTSAAENNNKLCNCREKNSCPLKGKCLQKGVVYQATIVQKHTNQKDTYIGITENEFKQDTINTPPAFDYHTKSPLQLCEHMWNLKTITSSTAFRGRLLKTATPTVQRPRSATSVPPENISF